MNNNRLLSLFAVIAAVILFTSVPADGKKLRHKLKVKTENKVSNSREKNKASADSTIRKGEAWLKVNADSICNSDSGEERIFDEDRQAILRSISFAGYDKQATSTRETFHIVNRSPLTLRKAEVEIVYLDMQKRMLHKRKVTVFCTVPAGETRKTDIRSWDSQYSFYYYLSNPPRRVAAPYQVEIHPLTFWFTSGSPGN